VIKQAAVLWSLCRSTCVSQLL